MMMTQIIKNSKKQIITKKMIQMTQKTNYQMNSKKNAFKTKNNKNNNQKINI